MKKVFLVGCLALGAAGCAMTPTQGTNQNPGQLPLYQACGSYFLAQTGAEALRGMNKLTVLQIQELTIAMKKLTPLCNPATQPKDTTAAVQEITKALTNGVLAMGLQYEQSQAKTVPAK